MSFFRFYWLRRLIRRHTTPIPYRKAIDWRNRFAVVYAFTAWTMLGYIGYEYSRGRGTKKSYGLEDAEMDMLSPSQQFAIVSGIEKAKIVRGLSFEKEDFNLEEYKHLRPTIETKTNITDDDTDNVA